MMSLYGKRTVTKTDGFDKWDRWKVIRITWANKKNYPCVSEAHEDRKSCKKHTRTRITYVYTSSLQKVIIKFEIITSYSNYILLSTLNRVGKLLSSQGTGEVHIQLYSRKSFIISPKSQCISFQGLICSNLRHVALSIGLLQDTMLHKINVISGKGVHQNLL